MIVKSDKVLGRHLPVALAIGLPLFALVWFLGIEVGKELFAGGISTGVVLAGFASRNRNDMLVQKETDAVIDIGKCEPLLDTILGLYRNSIHWSLCLVLVSVICLLFPSELVIFSLAPWFPCLIICITVFLRCEQLSDAIIKSVLKHE